MTTSVSTKMSKRLVTYAVVAPAVWLPMLLTTS